MLASQDAASSLQILIEAAERRIECVKQYPDNLQDDNDDDHGLSIAPILDKMIEQGGPAAYLSLTNFSGMEFQRLWDKISSFHKIGKMVDVSAHNTREKTCFSCLWKL